MKAPPTSVNLDVHREIVREVVKLDLDIFGVGNTMARRTGEHIGSMAT